jgi:hypothetical protein
MLEINNNCCKVETEETADAKNNGTQMQVRILICTNHKKNLLTSSVR